MRIVARFGVGVVLSIALCAAGCGDSDQDRVAKESARRQLDQAAQHVGNSEMAQAIELLKAIDREQLDDEGRASADRLESQAQAALGNTTGELAALERALDSGSLAPEDELAARYDLAVLYLQRGDPQRSLDAFMEWSKRAKTAPTVSQSLVMSETYAAAGRCSDAAQLIASAARKAEPEDHIDVIAAVEAARASCPTDAEIATLAKAFPADER